MIVLFYPAQWMQMQQNMRMHYTRHIMQTILSQQQPEGSYILTVRAEQFDILKSLGAFEMIILRYELDNTTQTYTIRLTSNEWDLFQRNLNRTEEEGAFNVKLTPQQYGAFKTAGYFEGLNLEPQSEPDGSFVIKMSPDEFQVFQANQERIKAAPQPQGEDEIAVTQDPSGSFVLQIPSGVWTILMRNQGLEGINVSPAPKPNPDGSYTITLSPDQWQTFQVNQSRPQSAPEPAATGEMPEISASQDPRGNYFLSIPASVWIIIRDNDVFKGIKFAREPTPNPDGSYTVKMTPDQWETFQVNQKTLNISLPAPGQTGPAPVSQFLLDITTSQDPRGNFFLKIPAAAWKILQDNDGFKGIKLAREPKPNPDGSYNVKLTPDQWQTFQVNQKNIPQQQSAPEAPVDDDNITASTDPSGNFVLRIPAGLWKIVQANDGFRGIKLKPAPTQNPDGSYTVTLSPDQWQTFQVNQKAPAQQQAAPDTPVDDDNITASTDPSGNFVLRIPSGIWTIVQANDGFRGIKLTPAPTQNPDGSYTVRLTPDQWETFQVNQRTPAQQQAAPAPQGPVDDDNITASTDSSGNFILRIPVALWKIVLANDGFRGISLSPAPTPSPDGSYSVKLTPGQWQTFQDNQKTPAPAQAASGQDFPITQDASGNYVLKFHAQQYETLKGSGGFDGISVSPRMEGSVYTLILSESDMARFKVNQDKINQPGDDSISVSLLASGDYQLSIPGGMWSMIQINNSFAGINLSPVPQPRPDGSYSIKLTAAEWAIFQANQAKGPAQPQAASEAASGDEIAVSVDASGFYILSINLAQYKMLKPSLAGIKVKPTTDKSGMMTFKLTEAQWQQFQKNQANGGPGKVTIPQFQSETEIVQSEEQRDIGKLKVEKDDAAPAAKPAPKRVGKLNNPFAKQEAAAQPAKRVGKIGSSRFGGKFGGSSTQNDGGVELSKSEMWMSRRAMRGPTRRAPTSNPVKNLGQRQDVTKDD